MLARSAPKVGWMNGNTVHNLSKVPEYRTWVGIKHRCAAPYGSYWIRGIRLAGEWASSFATFFEHVGPKPTPEHQIDRIDNARGYEPGNVRWATREEQARNKTTNRHLTFRGETKTLAEWASSLGFNDATLHSRLRSGWSVERALTQPTRQYTTWYYPTSDEREPEPALVDGNEILGRDMVPTKRGLSDNKWEPSVNWAEGQPHPREFTVPRRPVAQDPPGESAARKAVEAIRAARRKRRSSTSGNGES